MKHKYYEIKSMHRWFRINKMKRRIKRPLTQAEIVHVHNSLLQAFKEIAKT